MTPALIVTRRIPVFEFVIRTDRTVAENVALLDRYVSVQERPSGFYVQDPRLVGDVIGSTFELRSRGAWLWGSMIPIIDGQIVPHPSGSDVLVQVRHPRWSLALLAATILLLLVSIVSSEGIGQASFGMLASVVAIGLLLVTLPLLFHGTHAARVLKRVFSSAA